MIPPLGGGGGKKNSVGIGDGAPSTAHSSLNSYGIVQCQTVNCNEVWSLFNIKNFNSVFNYIPISIMWQVCLAQRSNGPLLTSKRHAVSVMLYYFQMAGSHAILSIYANIHEFI